MPPERRPREAAKQYSSNSVAGALLGRGGGLSSSTWSAKLGQISATARRLQRLPTVLVNRNIELIFARS